MRILMLTPYLPYPPSSGGQIRSYNLIKQLSEKHEITLCSLIKHDEEEKYVENLKQFCKKIYVFKRPEKPFTLANIIKTGTSSLPFLVVRNFSPSEKKALPEIIDEGHFDIIHAETFYVSPHIPVTDIPIVLVDQTIESRVYQHYVSHFKYPFLRPLLYLDVLKIKYWESFYWKKAVRVVAVSQTDAEVMKSIVPGLKVEVVPNGVGEDLMDDVPMHFSKQIMFIGNFAWLQNVEAARKLAIEVFPQIVRKIPDVSLLLVGQNTEKINNLARSNVYLRNLDVDDVDGVKQAFRESGVLVAPLYGPGGTRLKILGAMAARVPVVTTKVGLADLEAVHAESVLEGESTADLANLTVELLSDQKLYQQIAENARKLVERKYSYSAIAQKLSKVYEEVVMNKDD